MKCFAPLFVAAVLAAPASATIWNESIQGDLSSFESNPTFINLTLGDNIIVGTVGGDPASTPPQDFFDAWSFTLDEGLRIEQIIVEKYSPTGLNLSSGFQVFAGLNADELLANTTFGTNTIGCNVLLQNGDPLTAGDWTLSIREHTPDQQYTLNIIVTPTPASPVTFAIASFFLTRRR